MLTPGQLPGGDSRTWMQVVLKAWGHKCRETSPMLMCFCCCCLFAVFWWCSCLWVIPVPRKPLSTTFMYVTPINAHALQVGLEELLLWSAVDSSSGANRHLFTHPKEKSYLTSNYWLLAVDPYLMFKSRELRLCSLCNLTSLSYSLHPIA